MRRIPVLPLIAAVFFASISAAVAETDLPFAVHRLSERVLVLKELSPWESNHVVIVGERGLALIDPGHSAVMGRLIREAVARELGRDRFAYVIDTHGHWGHTWGNAAFPEALVIGHEAAAREIAADAANRERRAEFIRNQLAAAEEQLAGLDPDTAEAGAARLQRDHLERIVRGLEEPGFAVVPPQLTFNDRLGLDLGDLELEMIFLGRAHSDSDIAVLIPEEKILLLGCFVFEQGPLPIVGGQAQLELDPERWLAVLGELLADPEAIEHVVLGQHSVWPRENLVALRDYLADLWAQLQALDDEGVGFETALGRLPFPPPLDFVRAAGATEKQLSEYQRTQAWALWRQLKQSAAATLGEAADRGGAAALAARARELADDPDVAFDEAELNLLGYRLLLAGRLDEAIAVLELNVEHFPGSWNVYDSLGEAVATKGDIARAIALYRRSIELNPDNANGVRALAHLEELAEQTAP
jgi:glyoxylase-like metal-dependent hydrolase (beta-lactamase superfamily II)